MAVTDIKFRDLLKREDDARQALRREKDRLEKLGHRTEDERKELLRITAVFNLLETNRWSYAELVDPVFVATRDAFNEYVGALSRVLLNHDLGVLRGIPQPSQAALAAVLATPTLTDDVRLILEQAFHGGGNPVVGPLTDDDVVLASHVLGILAADSAPAPRVKVADANAASAVNPAGSRIVVDRDDQPAFNNFTAAFYSAVGQARGLMDLGRLVLPILEQEGDRDGAGRGGAGEVAALEFAKVMRCLHGKGITAGENQLRRRVNECLDEIQSVRGETVADMNISLPDLNDFTEYNIQAQNVDAFGPMICAAMFDELKAFEVVDKVVELWQRGNLPIGVGEAGKQLYEYWKSTPNRMSEGERRNFYALTMGIPGGYANGAANRDFNDLWIRFVSSVSSLVRQKTVDQILRANVPGAIGQQQVRKAARDLAANLSLHGYGMVNYAARDLQDQIAKIIKLLGDKEIMSAYGAKDMWQVIDQVASLELGGARNSARYRTLATCGAIITRWLSKNVVKFNSATSLRQVIKVDEVVSSDPPSAGPNATKDPTDYDLVNACELWLADTAVSDNRIEELSQPREAPAMTSRPVQIPSIARELLEQALPAGVGLGISTARH
jgi:hypothetical protein